MDNNKPLPYPLVKSRDESNKPKFLPKTYSQCSKFSRIANMNERQCYRLGFQIIRSQGRTGPTPTYNFQQFKVQSGQTHLVHLAIILPTVTSNCLIQTRHHNIQRAKNVHQFFSVIFSYHWAKKKNLSAATIISTNMRAHPALWTSGSIECTWR